MNKISALTPELTAFNEGEEKLIENTYPHTIESLDCFFSFHPLYFDQIQFNKHDGTCTADIIDIMRINHNIISCESDI